MKTIKQMPADAALGLYYSTIIYVIKLETVKKSLRHLTVRLLVDNILGTNQKPRISKIKNFFRIMMANG